MKPRHLLALSGLLPALAGCAVLGLDDGSALDRLERAEARWAEHAPAEYSFTLARLCFCPPPQRAIVVVEEGEVVTVLPAEPGGDVPAEARPYFLSIEGLFDEVRRALLEADEVDVTYDPRTGVPVRVAIDWVAAAVDDEVTYEVTGLSDAVPAITGDESVDRQRLLDWRAALRARAGTTCTSLAECRFVAMGVKACGGPAEYLVYSTAATDEATLLPEVAAYSAFSARLNDWYGWVSTCDITPEPVLGVVGGHCVDIRGP